MSTVRNVERQIYRCEKFRVQFRNKTTRRDVKGNLEGIPSYPHKTMAFNRWSVNYWIEHRFNNRYSGFDVKVLKNNGKAVQGRTLLSTVRDTYLEE